MTAAPKVPKASGEPPAGPSRPCVRSKGASHKALYGQVSFQSQLELNDIPESANEPGPGHYFGPGSVGFSAMGEQRMAKCISAPEINFPMTGWNEWAPVMISKAHSNTFLGKESPGAVYDTPDSLSKKATKIGTSLRPDLNLSLGIDPHGSPGPAYNLRDAPGASIGEPMVGKGRRDKTFGLASRFEKGKPGSIGPGQYARTDSALSSRSGRSIGVGRHAWEKVITPGWECEGRCRASPGPGPPLWRDIKTEGSRASSIGRADRFPRSAAESCSPGPGAYQVRDGGLRKAATTDAQSLAGESRGNLFGTAPKKPRFRQNLAITTSKRGGFGYF